MRDKSKLLDGEQPREVLTVTTLAELEALLEDHRIHYQIWEERKLKMAKDLLLEIQEGESVLVREPTGALLRIVHIVRGVVLYTDSSDTTWQLREDRQIFANGNERRRGYPDVREKLKIGEDPVAGMVRGLREELGVDAISQLIRVGEHVVREDSVSYPGLPCEAHNYEFQLTLQDDQYRKDGYVDHQPGKKDTYFVWEPR